LSNTITNHQRHAMIAAIMADVPQVDYDEMAQKAIEEYPLSERTPRPVQELWNMGPSGRSWLRMNKFYAYSFNVRHPVWQESTDLPVELQEKLKELDLLNDQQDLSFRELRSSLKAQLDSVRTFKALRARFPEFARYIPAEVKKSEFPLTTTSVMDNLRALGWPGASKA
jgi:hypothetical protein